MGAGVCIVKSAGGGRACAVKGEWECVRRGKNASGRYASYWNALLLLLSFL